MLMYMMHNATMQQRHDKLPGLRDEIKSFHFWKAVRCEFLVTLLYVFAGCGCTTNWEIVAAPGTGGQGGGLGDLRSALGFGLAAATMVQCVGHISGAHMNPAVSIAMLVTRNITVLRTFCYVLAQCAGSVTAAGILYGLTPQPMHGHLGVTLVHHQVGLVQAFGVEFMITFILVFTVFANVDVKRADMGSRSLSIGLAVILGHLFALPFTGSSMNPARSLGPAVVMNIWTHHWVYWVGPLLGAIIGGFTYEYTHDSSSQLQYFRRSFRRCRPSSSTSSSSSHPAARPTSLHRSRSTTSSLCTEMTYTPTPANDNNMKI